MEKLSKRKQTILDTIDEEIEALEEKLQKVQPLINELNQLKATRRTLLSDRGTTSGSGNPRTLLSMEEVILFLKNNGPSTPQEISEGLSVPGPSVRSHLSRFKGVRYQNNEGQWSLIGEEDDDEEEEDDEE